MRRGERSTREEPSASGSAVNHPLGGKTSIAVGVMVAILAVPYLTPRLERLRVAHAPWTNHGWHVALQPNALGFATLPTAASDGRTFVLTLDLCSHAITLSTSADEHAQVPLDAGSIAHLHSALVTMLKL